MEPLPNESIKKLAQFFELLHEIDKREKITSQYQVKNRRIKMTNKDQEPTVELIVAVKEAVEATTGVEFAMFFSAYLEKNADQPDLTEADLVAEILEAGGYQAEDDSTFEDSVMIGAFAMGEDLQIF